MSEVRTGHATNEQIAQRLDEVGGLLNEHGACVYRVAACRRAAISIGRLHTPVSQIYEHERIEGLRKLPGVGERIASAIHQLIVTGKLPILDRLRGEMDPITILMSVPGIGRVQAKRLHNDLAIDSLEDLEAAAHDGRLANIEVFGTKRIAGIIDCLASRLGRIRPMGVEAGDVRVDELLEVDREYRESAVAGRLAKIAPTRFNPKGETWLPVLSHRARGPTVHLYSRTLPGRIGQGRRWIG